MNWRALAMLGLSLASAAHAAEPPSPARAAALSHMLHQECGACHGLRLYVRLKFFRRLLLVRIQQHAQS